MNNEVESVQENEKTGKNEKNARVLAVMALILAISAFLSPSVLCYVFASVAVVFAVVAIKMGNFKKCAVVAIVFAITAILLQLCFDLFFEKLLNIAFDRYFWQIFG